MDFIFVSQSFLFICLTAVGVDCALLLLTTTPVGVGVRMFRPSTLFSLEFGLGSRDNCLAISTALFLKQISRIYQSMTFKYTSITFLPNINQSLLYRKTLIISSLIMPIFTEKEYTFEQLCMGEISVLYEV